MKRYFFWTCMSSDGQISNGVESTDNGKYFNWQQVEANISTICCKHMIRVNHKEMSEKDYNDFIENPPKN